MELSLGIAVFAGLVSFLSPCVLPIIPGFLGYLAGTTTDGGEAKKWDIFKASFFFVLGFSLVFSLLGVLLNTLLSGVAYEAQIWLGRIGGLIIIFFGLLLTGLVRLKFLEKDRKFQVGKKFNSKNLTSLLFGAAFAAGWTPCVGAVLGSVLALAASAPGSAFSLLFAYSLGLGVPFLLVGAFASFAEKSMNKFLKYAAPLNLLFGIVLIILGVLVFTNSLNLIANFGFINKFLL